MGGGGWGPMVHEPFTGAWQRNMEMRAETVATFHAVYACIKLIAQDIAKCRMKLVEQDAGGIWSEVTVPAFSPVLRMPNRYQNRIKFFEQWVISKLVHGNAYILKERDGRGNGPFQGGVRAMYVLDPCRTRALVADDGSVFYQVSRDNLSGIEEATAVIPASEIIHDVMVPLYHPLCGVSPITACGLAAIQGLEIQRNSARFFGNGAMPSGILTAPTKISEATARQIKEAWEQKFTGNNVGRVAVLGDGLKYESMSMNAVDAQLIDQLRWSSETVCSAFGVPPHKISIGQMPNYNNIQALDQQYYSQCLQALIESIEVCLDEGLGLPDVPGHTYGTEFDLDNLLRMDSLAQAEFITKLVAGAIYSPDEGRAYFGKKPVPGGVSPLIQQQYFSLAAIAKRDSQDDPFAAKNPTPSPSAAPADPPPPPRSLEPDDLDMASLAHVAAMNARAFFSLQAT